MYKLSKIQLYPEKINALVGLLAILLENKHKMVSTQYHADVFPMEPKQWRNLDKILAGAELALYICTFFTWFFRQVLDYVLCI